MGLKSELKVLEEVKDAAYSGENFSMKRADNAIKMGKKHMK